MRPENTCVKDDGSPRLDIGTAVSVPQVSVHQYWLDGSENGHGAKQSRDDLVVELGDELVQLLTCTLGVPLELEHPLHALEEELFPCIAPAVVLWERAHVGCDWESIFASRAWRGVSMKLGQARRKLADIRELFNQIAAM